MRYKATLMMLLAAIVILAVACGQNPLGSGNPGGLKYYSLLAKAVQKPDAINDEEKSKDGARGLVAEGTAAAKRAKAAGAAAAPAWLLDSGISLDNDGNLTYYEVVKDKPSEEDPDVLVTGRAAVVFKYSETGVTNIDPALITDIISWEFDGRQYRTWDGQTDSLRAKVRFAVTDITDIKPGKTSWWGMNISATDDLGKGDTASFTVDSLDDVNKVQYGEGHFLDAKSGEDNTGDPKPFDFDVEIHHKNTLGGNPYERYEDNEGVMHFSLPWGASGDSLYFSITFKRNWEREGTVRKNGPDGPVLIRFTHNEKTGAGTVTYYDEDGNELEQT